MSQPPKKATLITGCSAGGIGAALAHVFQKRGYLIFATTRNPSKIPKSLTSLPNVHALQLDVTSDASVAAAAESVKKILAEANLTGLNAVINNAGLGWWAPVLDIPMEDAKAIFETNFFGVIRVTQAFTPMLIDAKGTLVNVSSLAGEADCHEPFKSMYCASKAAVSQASETWRLELEPLGVRVITLALGTVTSQFFSDYEQEVKLKENSYFQPIKSHLDKLMQPDSKVFQDTDVFAAGLVKDIEAGKSGKLWRGGWSTTAYIASILFPTWLIDLILRARTPGAFSTLRDSRKGL